MFDKIFKTDSSDSQYFPRGLSIVRHTFTSCRCLNESKNSYSVGVKRYHRSNKPKTRNSYTLRNPTNSAKPKVQNKLEDNARNSKYFD